MVAIIEKGTDGLYGVYTNQVQGAYGFGETEQEAKADFKEILHEQALFYKEKKGSYPHWYSEDLTIEYRYDFSGFFLAFPFFNASKLAQALGINPSLMRKYKEGLAYASEKQKNMIQQRFNLIKEKINLVQF